MLSPLVPAVSGTRKHAWSCCCQPTYVITTVSANMLLVVVYGPVYACRGQRLTSGIFLSCSPVYFWDSLSLRLELMHSAGLACQQTPGILMFLPPCQCWSYRHAPHHSLFKTGDGNLNLGPPVCTEQALYWLSGLPCPYAFSFNRRKISIIFLGRLPVKPKNHSVKSVFHSRRLRGLC